MHRLLLPAALSIAACGGQPTEAPPAASSAPAVVSAPVVATPPLDVVLTLLGPGELEVAGTANVSSELRVEERAGKDHWKPLVQGAPFLLRSTCAETPATCTQLEAGHAVRVVRWPWSGLEIATQCPPTPDGGLGLAGTSAWPETPVRFVATSCDGKTSVASPVLVAPSSSQMPSAERRWAADLVTDVVAMRVSDSIPGWDGTSAPDPTRVAGFTIRPGTERALDAAARGTLAAALLDPKGYDDRVAKRCRMSHLVGFRVTRTLPTTGGTSRTQVLELGLDFNCNKLFITRGDSAPRLVHASHFDPSHAAWLGLVQSLFPNDAELAKVK